MCLLWGYVVFEHTMSSKWFQISISWTRKVLEHTLAPICWDDNLWTRQVIRFRDDTWISVIQKSPYCSKIILSPIENKELFGESTIFRSHLESKTWLIDFENGGSRSQARFVPLVQSNLSFMLLSNAICPRDQQQTLYRVWYQAP